MKISKYNSTFNNLENSGFKKYLLIFGFIFLGLFSQDVLSQTVNIEKIEDASEEDEVSGIFRISVSNLGFGGGNVNVIYNVSAISSASSDLDYDELDEAIQINYPSFGTGEAFINIEVNDDNFIEGLETIVIELVEVDSEYTVGTNDEITVNIVDNDFGEITVEADRPETFEGATLAADRGRFRLDLSSPNNTGGNVVVDYTLSGTATEGAAADYTTTGNATFVNTASFSYINIVPVNDELVEGDETVFITLNSVNNSSFSIAAPGTDNVTILDSEVFTASIGATDNEATETNTVTDTGVFTVRLDKINDTGNPITVNYSVAGTATSALDYTVLSGEVVIENGEQDKTFFVTPINDELVENPETVVVTLVTGNGYVLDSVDSITGTVTINDTDTFEVSIESTIATAYENPLSEGVFTVDVNKVNETGATLDVEYSIDGTADVGDDFTALSGIVSIENGESTGIIRLTPVDDDDIESNETVVLTLEDDISYNVGTPNSATIVIVSEDINQVQITASDATAAESNGAVSTGEFTVSLSETNNTGSPITINYVVSGTSVNSTDYTAISSNAVNILNGQLSAAIEIEPIDDLIQEGTETVIITLASGTGYILGATNTRTATVQINDNDQATLTISNEAVNEDIVSGELEFEVVLDIAVVGGTTVSYSFVDDTATGGGVDYTGTNGSLEFDGTANETISIIVPVNNDAILENTETFEVQLGVPSNNVQLVNGGSAIGTIQDDDNCVAAPVLDETVSNIYCVEAAGDSFSANLFDFTSSTAPTGTVLTWSRISDPLNTNSHLTAAEAENVGLPASYYGFFYDETNECASGTIEVQIVRNVIPQLIKINDNERCGPGTLLLSVEPSEGASIIWYDSLESTNSIAMGETYTTPSLNATATYYVEAEENGCISEREPVVARIGFQATTGTAQNGAICNIAANGLTSLDLDTRLFGADPGVWVFLSGPESNVNISSTNVVEFDGLESGAYIFSFTTTDSTAPCENISVEVTINVSDCETDDDEDGLLGGQEVALGTDSNDSDTDGDGVEDGDEVGDDINNPLDEDGDGIIDALESNIDDADNDGVNDQQDPANNNPCLPNRFNGSCDTDGDGISDLDEQTSGSDPDDPCDPVATPNCDDPIDLEVLKSVDNIDALIGDTIIFKILVTNLSDRTARAIVIGDLLELGFDFVSADSADYDEISGNWSISELAAGISTELSITAIVAEQGPYTNTATLLESIPADNNSENDEATVELSTEAPEGIDLEVVKRVSNMTPLVGEEITFTISVENKSKNRDVIGNIEIDDILPSGEEAGFVYVSDFSSTGDYDESTGRWSIASLEFGEQNAATLDITVSVPIVGTFSNTATLIRSSPGDSNVDNNSDEVMVVVDVPTAADPGFLFNQFSPNGDNTNDVLRINLRDEDSGLDAGINYKIIIHDRYGNRVFEGGEIINDNTQRTADVWDGTYEGKEVPKGTYFYIMNYRINNEDPIIDKGWIQLIR
ncbi:Calx-beta domain-containing protein [Maribacter sp. Asnod1-A12]|uniref:Calx-beta domain-containing protein n=1 Tax=Maribacter sp. Asnod1-A12 TaxID=3160576 RepID=UPI00386485E4